MAEQSAARLEGDRYQHLYSWYLLLSLLDDDSPYEYAFVEHPAAGSADDVTLHPFQGSAIAAHYYQIKWHVDQRDAYSFASLATITSGARSLLEKLFDSWRELRKTGPVEVWLVSNWPSAQDLGGFIRSRGHSFSDDFFICKPRSVGAKARRAWMKQLGADDAEILDFCRDLRLRLGFAGVSDLEEMVDDRMARYGLRLGANAQADALDEIRRWIEVGGGSKRITRDDLLEVITRRGLRAAPVSAPAVSLWVHGWGKRAFDLVPTVDLDWTSYFDRATRQIPSHEIWEQTLFGELSAARDELSGRANGSYIDFRGKVPLTATLAIGAVFSEVAGFAFRAEQPTQGETFLWRSDAKASARAFRIEEETYQGDGQDLLIALCITGDGRADVRALTNQLTAQLKASVYAEPDNGSGDAAITSNEDAVALAVRAKELIRSARNRYHTNQTHLVLYAPASFCLFLGQRLNALGRILTYERTAAGGYQPSVVLATG